MPVGACSCVVGQVNKREAICSSLPCIRRERNWSLSHRRLAQGRCRTLSRQTTRAPSSTTRPRAKLVRQVLGAISEFDKAMTVAKLRGARERKRREAGKCEGRKSHAGAQARAAWRCGR